MYIYCCCLYNSILYTFIYSIKLYTTDDIKKYNKFINIIKNIILFVIYEYIKIYINTT